MKLKKLNYKRILIKVGITVLSLVLLLWLADTVLKSMTNHGETAELPSVKGLSYDEARILLESKDFECVISDSLFVDQAKPNEVIEQEPAGATLVKPGRMVYLKVNCLERPLREVPNVIGIGTLRDAVNRLTRDGFRMGDTIPQIDDEMDDQVLEQLHNGKKVSPGTLLPQGSFIDLVVTKKREKGGDTTGDGK